MQIQNINKKNNNNIYMLTILLFLSFMISIFNGYLSSISFFCGGLVSIIPNFVYMKIFFKKSKNESAKKIMFRLSLGFLLKMILVIFFFACIFLINKLLSFWVILGFVFTTLLFLIANFFNFRKKNKSYLRGEL